MSHAAERLEMPCAVCGPGAPYRVRFAEKVDAAIDFAARKVPSRQHFRVVQCARCGLVYSSPILPPDAIERLYRDSPFIQEEQLGNMVRDYQDQLRHVMPLLPGATRLLEIGCANGLFLRAAQELGFSDVWGVEPGEAAVRLADPVIRGRIVNAPFSAELFPSESFDVVCCFQVLDHLLEPNAVLRGAAELLRPGGVVLLLNHNVRSWFPRLLGERCPIYDVEHVYLFDKRTVARLLLNNGLHVVCVRDVANGYALSYALKMFPLPGWLKSLLLRLAGRLGAANWRVRLPAGNMVAVGRKVASAKRRGVSVESMEGACSV
jgi:SAM-dependent methyltransferase